jgi:inosine/xanthosine triphosphate pyrophosphatase family protein
LDESALMSNQRPREGNLGSARAGCPSRSSATLGTGAGGVGKNPGKKSRDSRGKVGFGWQMIFWHREESSAAVEWVREGSEKVSHGDQ